ncbi:cell division protein [Acinetobacter larvae]|uniref:Cell division protein n=2 Tax=Acinetobacter larvae TaxID=1789224 RepID=A0A1B2M217_9GAMM|nr:cell division protein [Acinetobacter larvae]
MNNKQRWLGGVVLLGGGALLAALLLKGKEELHQQETQVRHPVEQVRQANPENQPEAVPLQPLTVDVETEKRLLAEQKRAREKANAEQEAKAAEFLRMQQQAEAEAARKAAEEYAALNARRKSAQDSSDNIPPELVNDAKNKAATAAKTTAAEEAKKKAELEQKRREQAAAKEKVDADNKRKAEAEQKAKAEADAKRKAAEKAKAEEAKKKAEADAKHKAEEAKKKAEAEKARQIMDGDSGSNSGKQWMVQVALAANQANADALAAKLRAKGYKVTQSKTSKGIRIMVGPAKDREAADATRKKINSDSSLNMKSAWVIDWVPLDQR